MNSAMKNVAVYARPTCAKGRFDAKLQAGNCKTRRPALKRCATVIPGAINTTSEAVYLPVSKVFSCPKFKVLDVGRAYPQGWPQRFGVVDIPHVHSADLSSQRMVFVTPEGAKAMTSVIRTITPKAATLGTTPAISLSSIARQQAIENALTTALYFVRLPVTESGLRAATGRAIRAASMLKQACAESTSGRA